MVICVAYFLYNPLPRADTNERAHLIEYPNAKPLPHPLAAISIHFCVFIIKEHGKRAKKIK